MKFLNKRTSKIFITLFFLLLFLFSQTSVNSATLLSDDFTGTAIDTNKWIEIDTAGAGGGSGNIQQNGP